MVSIIKRVFCFCRRLCVGSVLLALLGVAAWGVYAYRQIDNEICQQIEDSFAQQSEHLRARIRFARRHQNGIELTDFQIVDSRDRGKTLPLVEIDRVFLHCPTGLKDLVKGRPEISQISLRRPTLRLDRLADGGWNIEQLLQLKSTKIGSFGTPTITIEDGTIEISDRGKTKHAIRIDQVNLTVKPKPTAVAKGTSQEVMWKADGNAASNLFDRLEVDAHIDQSLSNWRVAGDVKELSLEADLRHWLAIIAPQTAGQLATIHGKSSFTFSLANPFETDGPNAVATLRLPRFTAQGDLHNGVINDRRLPLPLTPVNAKFACSNAGIKITEFTARSGETTLWLSGHMDGYTRGSPIHLESRLRGLQLNDRLREVLPRNTQATWQKVLPEGVIDLDATVNFDGERWHAAALTAVCKEVAFTYHKFPYRLEKATGQIAIENGRLQFRNFVAWAGNTPVHIDGQFENLGPAAIGFVKVSVDKPLVIDERLVVALNHNEKTRVAQRVIRSLAPQGARVPQGSFLFRGKFSRPAPNQPPIPIELTLQPINCKIAYDKFPYPLSRVNGIVEVKNNRWKFHDFTGYNGSGYVTCSGSLGPASELIPPAKSANRAENVLRLVFNAEHIPLDDDLRTSLPVVPNDYQKVWTDLRPRGSIDLLHVEADYPLTTKKLSLAIDATKFDKRHGTPDREISLKPKWFDYRLDHVSGEAKYRDGNVTFKKVHAKHGQAYGSANGNIQMLGGGKWKFGLHNLSVHNLVLDQDLRVALPARLADSLAQLKIRGPISLSTDPKQPGTGSLVFSGGGPVAPNGRPSDSLSTRWNLMVDMEDGQMNCGVKLEHIRGGVHLFGAADRNGFHCDGRLLIDSVAYNDMYFSNVRGPIWIDPKQIVLGSSRYTSLKTRSPITAKAFGGNLSGRVEVSTAENHHFTLDAQLLSASLASLTRDGISQRQQASGKVDALLNLVGDARGKRTWAGGGKILLSEADIYQLPLMVSLLKVITATPPDSKGFDSGQIGYTIRGEHIYLDNIKFYGNALSLYGQGVINLDREIENMKLYTQVGRNEFADRFLRTLTREAGKVFSEIKVTGSLDAPDIQINVLPQVSDAIKRFFSEPSPIINGRQSATFSPTGPIRSQPRLGERR